MSPVTIALVSSDAPLAESVRQMVASVGQCRFVQFPNFDSAIPQVSADSVAVVVVHLEQPDDAVKTRQLLQSLALARKTTAIVAVSDQYHAAQALELMRGGVADYHSRPLDLKKLAFFIDVVTARARYTRNESPSESSSCAVALPADGDSLLYHSEGLGPMMQQIRMIAPQDTTVLLNGETGTGKTRLARLIHELSPRRRAPFLVVDCGALSANLIESEMFGHVRGAFTGADRERQGKLADVADGTLLLDDIDALGPTLQAKLLRVVEDRVFEPVGSNRTVPMRARLIVATNKSLEAEVAARRFRADLYYRLNVVQFCLPPLRERRSAIRALAGSFIVEYATRSGKEIHGVAADALEAMESYYWPGNIRELRNVVERAIALSSGHQIGLSDLPVSLSNTSDVPDRVGPAVTTKSIRTLSEAKNAAERDQITAALVKHNNNRLQTAIELGISRVTLYKKLHHYRLI